MTVNWIKMSTILKPVTGKRFAIIKEAVTDTMELVDLKLGYVIMADSFTEKETAVDIIEKAHGDVLFIGFGIGFVLTHIVNKPEVRSITIIEKYQEVLDIVASQFKLPSKVRIILSDGLTWQPDMMFDTIYEDCEYIVEDGEIIKGSPYENYLRLEKYLKPNGLHLEWRDDGRFRS